MMKMKSLLLSIIAGATLIACAALPSFASDPAPMDFTVASDVSVEYQEHAPAVRYEPSINELIDRVVGWAPDWIVEPIKIWANYLIIGSSILMLFLRLLIWVLPTTIANRFNWLLGPVATAFRQLTRVLDLIAINSSSNTGGPNKKRGGG
jgi:hypothetical protein